MKPQTLHGAMSQHSLALTFILALTWMFEVSVTFQSFREFDSTKEVNKSYKSIKWLSSS